MMLTNQRVIGRSVRPIDWLIGLLTVIGAGAGLVSVASARALHAGPADYVGQLEELRPGDVLQLEPGVYRRGLHLDDTEGAPGQPITVTGPAHGPQAVFIAQNGSDTVRLKNAAFITIRNLVLNGRGRNADAVKATSRSRYAHHITLENLIIRGYDRGQQFIGISTKCPAWDWVIRGNVIARAGTGLYLGDSDGSAPFIGGLIENNVVRDTIGYNMEIKRQAVRPAGHGIPQKPRETIIRHNIFSKASGGSTQIMARPNVLLGAWPEQGPGRHDRYLVYGNLFYQNPTEALLQATGRVAVYSNLFLNTMGPGRAVVIMRHHERPPEDVDIFHNTIVATEIGVAVRDADPDRRQWVAANAIFAATPTSGKMQRDWNVVAGLADAGALKAPFDLPEALDFSPRPGRLHSPQIPAGSLVDYPGAERSFSGRLWRGGVAGACPNTAETYFPATSAPGVNTANGVAQAASPAAKHRRGATAVPSAVPIFKRGACGAVAEMY